MNISYSHPLELGWRRMKRTLFQPFDLGRWMVLGFTAWLAQLGDSSNGGSGGQDGINFTKNIRGEDFQDSTEQAWHWLADFATNSLGMLLVSLIVVGVLVFAVLALWISSRGRFMFLDNLIHNRTEVSQPWHEFQKQADSLFMWQIGYFFVAVVILGVISGGFVALLVPALAFDLPAIMGLPLAIGLGTALFMVVVTLSYIDYFLNFFIVPIMHKHRVNTTAAWKIFLPVLKAHPGPFAGFGLLFLGISIVMGIAFMIGGALTCCVGLLLMALPYIGAVVTLPISVLARFMSLEFLAQFGDDFTLLDPLPESHRPHSGHIYTDGAVIRPEDVGEDSGTDETGPQGT